MNFPVGDWPDADKAFHFNPRFGENTVVRNTCQAGSWGGEERQQNNFPFQQGVNFDICIAVEHDKYKVQTFNFISSNIILNLKNFDFWFFLWK